MSSSYKSLRISSLRQRKEETKKPDAEISASGLCEQVLIVLQGHQQFSPIRADHR